MREIPRRRPVTVVIAVVLVVVIIGIFREGFDFLTTTIPLPGNLAAIWFTTNWFLALIACFFLYRNLTIFEDRWDWQELAVSRGLLLLLFGALLGYLARVLNDPEITLATPLTFAGLLLIIQGTVRRPERFEKEHRGQDAATDEAA